MFCPTHEYFPTAQTTTNVTILTIKNIHKPIMAMASKGSTKNAIIAGMVTAKAFNHWAPPIRLDVMVENVGQPIDPESHNIAIGSIMYV